MVLFCQNRASRTIRLTLGFGISRVAMGAAAGIRAARVRLAAGKGGSHRLSLDDRFPQLSGARAGWYDANGRIVQKSAQMRAFEKGILREMENGTAISKEIAKRLKSGDLEVRFQELSDGRLGRWTEHNPNTIYINSNFLRSGSRWRPRIVAGWVVHEGIHYLGGGEIAAHMGEAQFLNTRLRARRSIPRNRPITRADFPYLDRDQLNLLFAYNRGW
ncbi:MAG: hypothetical protein ACE5JS_02555 [Nitrospinota bacterium]